MYYVWQLKYVKMYGNIEARLVLKSCHLFIYGTHWFKGLDQTLKRVKIVKEIFQQGVEHIVTTHVTFQCLEPCMNSSAIL